MGSMISLGIGRMEIDWGKNNIYNDHSILFTPDDIKQIPYYYVDYDGNQIIVKKEGLSRSLKSMKRRLDLLGYTLKNIETRYNDLLQDEKIHGSEIALSFRSFLELLKNIDINNINTPDLAKEYDENGYDLGEFVRRCILPEQEISSRLPQLIGRDKYDLNFSLECFLENMDPYIILRLLAENPSCNLLNVYWSYADAIDGGWLRKEDIVKPLPSSQKILIVTEGSSDTFIIKKTIESLYPDISDFFVFIDMEKNYPFTGTGNLYNFCCGLMKIGILNKIIVLFDNDTAGKEKYDSLQKLPKLKNLMTIQLPNFSDFNKVVTIGPQGKTMENINGKAVAIECFLDFTSVSEEPAIRWTNYVEKQRAYQGALQNKDEYVRKFKEANLCSGNYNVSKLKYLIDYLIEKWCTYYQET